jgi:hypothetical protein
MTGFLARALPPVSDGDGRLVPGERQDLYRVRDSFQIVGLWPARDHDKIRGLAGAYR